MRFLSRILIYTNGRDSARSQKKLFTLFFLFEGQTGHFRGMTLNVLWIRQRKYVSSCQKRHIYDFLKCFGGGGQNIFCPLSGFWGGPWPDWPPGSASGEEHDRKERNGTGWRGTGQGREGRNGKRGTGRHGVRRKGVERDGTG